MDDTRSEPIAKAEEGLAEMQTVLDTGKRRIVKRKPGMVSVLSPIRNSLGDIVGLVEVVGRPQPDTRENVK